MAGDWRVYILSTLLGLGALAGVVWSLDLFPVREARIAAGAEGGGYHTVALAYREILAEDGIALEIVETAGSVENAALLAKGEVDLALLQGGVPVPESAEEAEAIAALFYEPVLFFARRGEPVGNFPPDWRELRIGIGAKGSGVRFAWDRLAVAMSLEPGANRLIELSGTEALAALEEGRLDLALFVAPVETGYLRDLILDGDLRPLALDGTEAIARSVPELDALTLPPGALSYARRVPAREIEVLAARARLVARAGLHPALVDRLVHAAWRLHSGATRLSAEGTFPSVERVGMAVDTGARALVQQGPPVIDQFLPYWVSAQINRFIFLLLPALFLLLPLVRMLPVLYEWLVRRRILVHYEAIRDIDVAVPEARSVEDLDRLDARLQGVEDQLRRLDLPLAYRQSLYLTRSHLELVRRRIAEARAAM